MANKFRFSAGEDNAQKMPVPDDVNIEVGDCLFLDGATNLRNSGSSTADYKAYPFSSLSTGSLTSELVAASDYFLGIALEAATSGDRSEILVGTDGDWNLDAYTASTAKLGYFIEPYGATAGNITDQTVEVATTATNPLGYCLTTGSSQTTVKVRLRTVYGFGGKIS